ncbi:uncharacterized protein B0H18DRAFT_1007759 [Fomitopsis serialis]|uniref:uncharacterized protein n=1 Tax=Fomitopsis serialis TaxID=139415 RepID=UPI002008B9A0|nr:uncharacterized protein B0H18DRAFT_1007759 [Neoantrodia serialis]KAH9926068.1 hypothetical protein B0H18DRAFT_1007759 [Neoantrodia serialis]
MEVGTSKLLSYTQVVIQPERPNPGTAAATLPTLRTNAMSLGFILSGHLWNGLFEWPAALCDICSPSSSTTEDVLEYNTRTSMMVEPIIRGWAPPDPDHCTSSMLWNSETTVFRYHQCLPVALPIALTGLPRVCSWSRNDLGSTTASLGQAPVGLGAPTSGNHQHNLIRLTAPPANSQHLAAGLTGVHRYHGLALAAHTRGPIPVPVSASPLTIPPPRAVVSRLRSRGASHISGLRVSGPCRRTRRALIRWGRFRNGNCVLGKSVRETPRRMGCEGMCTCGGCR